MAWGTEAPAGANPGTSIEGLRGEIGGSEGCQRRTKETRAYRVGLDEGR